ncbi:DUF3987 domain-containing protein, partial [Escherichia coli]|uniref:DUF3987 domain-containing protein n=1 Tax=Escherichia coli TaxID=562 RepID=UPI0010CB5E3F
KKKKKKNPQKAEENKKKKKKGKVLKKTGGKKPVGFKLIFNEARKAAIKEQLWGEWGSVGFMSDEAGIIFDGYTLSELPFINKMWDGSVLSVDRKNEPEQM